MTPNHAANDPSFRLSPADRANIIADIDVDALERLLQRLPEAEREFVLRGFLKPAPGSATSFQIIGVHGAKDPEVAALLEEIWAPTWQAWGPEAIEKEISHLPGRDLARARLGLDEKRKP